MQANLPLNDGYWLPVASAGHPYWIVDAGSLSKSSNIFLGLAFAFAGRTYKIQNWVKATRRIWSWGWLIMTVNRPDLQSPQRQTFTVFGRGCLYYINRGRRTHHACRRHHSMDWGPGLKQRRIQCKHSSVFASCLWTYYDRLPQAPVPMSPLQWLDTPCESYQTLLL